MFIILVDGNKQLNIKIENFYLYKGIKIQLKNNHYYLYLLDNYHFSDNSKFKILEIKTYEIINELSFNNIYLYVYDNDFGLDHYELFHQKEIIISDESVDCTNKDPYLKGYYLKIKDKHLQSNYKIILNNKRYNQEELKAGDHIEFLSHQIFFYDDFLYLNCFKLDIRLEKYFIKPNIIKYFPNNIIRNNFYLPTISELKFDDLLEFKPNAKKSDGDYLKSALPSFLMCSATFILSYNNYLSNNNASMLSYFVSPIAMFLTSVFIPLIYFLFDNFLYKKEYRLLKTNYLDYLNDYQNDIDEKVRTYLKQFDNLFFDPSNSQFDKLCLNKNNDYFLTISVGKINKEFCVKYKLTNDNEINEKIKKIINRLANINECPLFIDLKKKRNITIISKNSDKDYLFMLYIYELIIKNDNRDFYLAIFSQDDQKLRYLNNLEPLFIDNYRLVFKDEKSLQELDRLKLEKRLILLCDQKINISFNNELINVLYFTDWENDIYKNSELCLNYFNNHGYLLDSQELKFNFQRYHIIFSEVFNKFCLTYETKNKNNLRFKDLFNLNIEKYYFHHDLRLRADFAYNENGLIDFDLHERHCLVAGATGSGKSELLISLLLSLCLKYPPDYLNIVILDYKGSGLVQSLSFQNQAVKHIVANISNIDDKTIERLIVYLKNECLYRQNLFEKLSKISCSVIMNLDDYLSKNNMEFGLTKIAHLLIVVDEFAELKKQRPETIKELISISRIGRSLGVHLILSTQKPSGNIDEEIISNCYYKIALKVYDEKDSQDIIKSNKAYFINQSGDFYLKVNDSLIKASSIYSKYDYFDSSDYAIALLDDNLAIKKTYKTSCELKTDEASEFVRNINLTCQNKNYYIKEFNYLPNKPLIRKEIKTNKILLGEIDDYLNNQHSLLIYEIDASILIYSSRNKEINSILNCFNAQKRKMIIISNNYYTSPYILDCLKYDDEDNLLYLFNRFFNSVNLDITLIIDDVNCLLSYDEKYLDILIKLLKRKDNLGLSIIMLNYHSQLNFKIASYFNNKVLIQMLDENDILDIFGHKSLYKGDSYVLKDQVISFVPIQLEDYENMERCRNPFIKNIPALIRPSINNNKYLIGYDLESRLPIYEDDILITSFDSIILSVYKQAYPSLNVQEYSKKILDLNYTKILWLKSGIYNQRLFIYNLLQDLNDSEGLLVIGSKKIKLRILNVSNNVEILSC